MHRCIDGWVSTPITLSLIVWEEEQKSQFSNHGQLFWYTCKMQSSMWMYGNVWKHTLQDYSLPTEWWAVKTCNPSWEAKSHNHQRTLSYFESSHNTSYHGHGFEITTAVNLYFQPIQFVVGGSSKELSLEIVKRSSICWILSLQMWWVQHCQFIIQVSAKTWNSRLLITHMKGKHFVHKAGHKPWLE